MSLTQTYYLAHTARAKLSREAARADHNLRRLVGHANLLDGLMLDLAEAEREQETWFNQSVDRASEQPNKHIQWAESLPTVVEDFEEDSSDDSDSDGEEEEISYTSISISTSSTNTSSRRPVTSQPLRVVTTEVTMTEYDDDEEEEEDDEEELEGLQLRRTQSVSSMSPPSSPPELFDESDSEEEDDSVPPSPTADEIPLNSFSEKQRRATLTNSKVNASIARASSDEAFFDHIQPQAIAAY